MMKRSNWMLPVVGLSVMFLAVWSVRSQDDPTAADPFEETAVADPFEVDSDKEALTSEEQREALSVAIDELRGSIESRQHEMLAMIAAHGPEVARHEYVLERMIELRSLGGELEVEIETMARHLERTHVQAEAAVDTHTQLRQLRREAVELSAMRVETLMQGTERARVLIEQGAISSAEVVNIESELQSARIALVEQQIALAELEMPATHDGGEVEAALQQLQERFIRTRQQLDRMQELLRPSLDYRTIEDDVSRRRELLSTLELKRIHWELK